MARIRSVKPELCTSETMAAVSANAERTFVRLWTHCDDEGRCKDHPKLLKAQLYPLHDDVTAECVDADLAELERHGCIVRYSVSGERFLSVPSWSDHQKPQKRQASKLPGPDQADPVDDQPVQDDSDTTTRPLPEGYGPVVEGRVEVDGGVEVEGDGPTSTGTTDEVVEPPAVEAVVVDEQSIRACAVAVGRAIAANATPPPVDPAGYAAAATKRILRGDDPTDRDRIRAELEAGKTPEQIAAGWDQQPPSWVDGLLGGGQERVQERHGPRLEVFAGHDAPERPGDGTGRVAALRAQIAGRVEAAEEASA